MAWFVFVLGALISLLGAYGVVTRANPVHAALSLIGTLFGIAVLFISLEAEFLAAMQVIVYAGAIVVLILFVIMLLGVDRSEDLAVEPLTGQRTGGIIAGVVLGLGLIGVAVFGAATGLHSLSGVREPGSSDPVAIGRVVFTEYLWAFELAAVLLIIATVGAVVLARHRPDSQVDDSLPGDIVEVSLDLDEDAELDTDAIVEETEESKS